MHLRTRDLLPFSIKFDFPFIKNLLKTNRKYWFSYFFSSFHTLLVLMFLGWFFPTAAWFKYAGIWALALSLIEILLIIPSSLGNSLLHKIPHYTDQNKKRSLWNLMILVTWIGLLIAMNFWIFAEDIIVFVSSKSFLGTWESIASWWSDQVLPFLGVVLVLSFIKQVYNYLFVALEQQNLLFWVNLTGVLIGAWIWIYLIPHYGLLWGVITQVLIEVMFAIWAMWIWKNKWMAPILDWKVIFQLLLVMLIFGMGWYFIHDYLLNVPRGVDMTIGLIKIWAQMWEFIRFFMIAGVFNIAIAALSIPVMKKVARGLTAD